MIIISLSVELIKEKPKLLFYVCKNCNADLLLIDDKKARQKAELLGIKCIGTLGLLYYAKQKQLIHELRPIFIKLIENKRYYSKEYVNMFITKAKELTI